MSFKCEICGKGPRVANNVSHSNIKSKRVQRPNLHSIKVLKNGHRVKVLMCTRCIRTGNFEKAS